ncbi:MAG: hypothetical protein AB2A00_18170, partial [Myxococcota bacterium]
PLKYPEVEPVFIVHCHRCHHKDHSTNTKAMAVYEGSAYPFPSTDRPDRILAGLEDMFRTRRGLDDAERCLALTWIAGGARDSEGNLPPWPQP